MNAPLLHRLRALLLAGACLVLAGWAFGESLPGSLPLRRDAEAGASGGMWMPSLLLLGLALAAGGYAWWRRGAAHAPSAARRADAAVTRLSSQPLTPHASVHAVQWNGEEFLLACTAQQVTVLARRPVDGGEGGIP
jgi:hypothetical protein